MKKVWVGLVLVSSVSFADLKPWIGKAPQKKFFALPDVSKSLAEFLKPEEVASLANRKWPPFSYVDHILASCATPEDPKEDTACLAIRVTDAKATVSFSKDRYNGPIDWRTKESTVEIKQGPSFLEAAKFLVAGCRPLECSKRPSPPTSIHATKSLALLQTWVEKHPFEVDPKTKKDFLDQPSVLPHFKKLLNKKGRDRLETDLTSVKSGFDLWEGVLVICGSSRSKKEKACLLYDSNSGKLYAVFKDPNETTFEWVGTEAPDVAPPVPFAALIGATSKRACCY